MEANSLQIEYPVTSIGKRDLRGVHRVSGSTLPETGIAIDGDSRFFIWRGKVSDEKKVVNPFESGAEIVVNMMESEPFIRAVIANENTSPTDVMLGDIALSLRALSLLYLSDLHIRREMMQRAPLVIAKKGPRDLTH